MYTLFTCKIYATLPRKFIKLKFYKIHHIVDLCTKKTPYIIKRTEPREKQILIIFHILQLLPEQRLLQLAAAKQAVE